jgi:hypothetical protein
LTLKLEFKVPGRTALNASATIFLTDFSTVEKGGLPAVSSICASIGELEGELHLIEMQIASIRNEAKRRFLAAGISN